MNRCDACNANLLTKNTMFFVFDKKFCDEMCARTKADSDTVEAYGETVSTASIVGRMTVEQFISELTDKELTVVFEELNNAVVPRDGEAYELCRVINNNIDRGILYISQYTYRRMYLPSLVKCINKELAMRYVKGGRICGR